MVYYSHSRFSLSHDIINDVRYRSKDVQTHLTKVYRLLSVVMLTSIVGAAIQIQNHLMTQMVFPYILALIAVMVSIACIPREHFFVRIGLALFFGFLQGENTDIDVEHLVGCELLIARFPMSGIAYESIPGH